MGFPPGELHPSWICSFGGGDLRDFQNLDLDYVSFREGFEVLAAFALRLQQAPENERTAFLPRLNEQLLVLHALDFAPQSCALLKLDPLRLRAFALLSFGSLHLWQEFEEAGVALAEDLDLNALSDLYALVRIRDVILVEVLEEADADSVALLRALD